MKKKKIHLVVLPASCCVARLLLKTRKTAALTEKKLSFSAPLLMANIKTATVSGKIGAVGFNKSRMKRAVIALGQAWCLKRHHKNSKILCYILRFPPL